jgi:hypothetical protein
LYSVSDNITKVKRFASNFRQKKAFSCFLDAFMLELFPCSNLSKGVTHEQV